MMPVAQPDSRRLLTLATVVSIVAVLWLARTLLIPIAFALVLGFVLAPIVTRLERLGLGRALSVATTVGLSLMAVAMVGWIVAVQAIGFAEALPTYRESIREKLSTLVGQTEGWMSRAWAGIETVQAEIRDATDGEGSAAVVAQEAPRPGSVPATALDPQAIPGAIAWLVDAAIAAGIVVIFVTFILLKREDLRDRAIALAGAERLNLTTQVVDDAAQRVSRYLLALLLVNIAFGAVIGVGLLLIGVPNALLFGALVVPLRFVPVIGLWIAAGVPVAVAMITLDGWTGPLLTIALFAAVEVVVAYLVEPWAFGTRTGMPISVVLLALVFWTWLWGAPGLVLAMPLTVCLAAIGRHLPNHPWLRVLLDEKPALPDSARIYQRLLALDGDEALAVARVARTQHGLAWAYDEAIMPALAMFERDRHAGAIVEDRSKFMLGGLRDIIDDQGEDRTDEPARPTAPATPPRRVVCLPARDDADELAGLMLARLLDRRGVRTELLSVSMLFNERIAAARGAADATVCVSAMPPSAEMHARLTLRRIKEAADGVPPPRTVIGIWGADGSDAVRERLSESGADLVAASLVEAVRAIAGEVAAR